MGVEAEAAEAEAAAKAARAETAAAEAAMEAHPSESIRQMVGWVRGLQARLDAAIDHGIDRSGLGRVVEATSTKTARHRSLQPPRPTRGCDPTRPACTLQPLGASLQPHVTQARKADLRVRSLRRALDALAPHETGGGGAAIDDASTALDSALQEASLAMAADWRPTPQADAPATLPARGGEAVGQRVTEALDSPPVAAAVPAAAASAGSLDGFAAKVRILREWSWVRLTPRASSAEPAEPADRAPTRGPGDSV